jgi:hypothetical protein
MYIWKVEKLSAVRENHQRHISKKFASPKGQISTMKRSIPAQWRKRSQQSSHWDILQPWE